MTKEEILKMEAGKYMNTLVAGGPMGWKVIEFKHSTELFKNRIYPIFLSSHGTLFRRAGRCPGESWSPSTDISAAFEVVEKFATNDYVFELMWIPKYQTGQKAFWSCTIRKNIKNEEELFNQITTFGETAPLAICRAALLTVMEDK